MSFWSRITYAFRGDRLISIGGGQPDTEVPVATGKFHVDGQYALPE